MKFISRNLRRVPCELVSTTVHTGYLLIFCFHVESSTCRNLGELRRDLTKTVSGVEVLEGPSTTRTGWLLLADCVVSHKFYVVLCLATRSRWLSVSPCCCSDENSVPFRVYNLTLTGLSPVLSLLSLPHCSFLLAGSKSSHHGTRSKAYYFTPGVRALH